MNTIPLWMIFGAGALVGGLSVLALLWASGDLAAAVWDWRRAVTPSEKQ
jgi:hypothetical protein